MRIRILDRERMPKSFEEYLEEYGYMGLYDPDKDIVFASQFYKDAHFRYIEYQTKTNNKACQTGLPIERIEAGEARISSSQVLNQLFNDTTTPVQK